MGCEKGNFFGGKSGFDEKREVGGSDSEMGMGGKRVWVREEREKLTFLMGCMNFEEVSNKP